jgi:hypothetical protein
MSGKFPVHEDNIITNDHYHLREPSNPSGLQTAVTFIIIGTSLHVSTELQIRLLSDS